MEHFFRKLHAILHILVLSVSVTFCAVSALFFIHTKYFTPKPDDEKIVAVLSNTPLFDTLKYDYTSLRMANYATNTPQTVPPLWPVSTLYPNVGALLPMNRIIAYYGNLYSKKMGVLGEYPREEMLAKLMGEVEEWQKADPKTPTIPALHYIAVTAQGYAGEDKMYRLRMPAKEINKVLDMASEIHALVFLDIQVGKSTVQEEVPPLDAYLKMPQVHFGIDPEFAMQPGKRPGQVIGTLDAADINFVIDHLAQIVRDNKLPPKILIVHRFTQRMVTNYQNIKTVPEVQVVMDMDGWGPPKNKLKTYADYVYDEPVEFAGFKLFYKNDIIAKGSHMMTPDETLKLTPRPMYIQYQ
jgi:hypothetical protein